MLSQNFISFLISFYTKVKPNTQIVKFTHKKKKTKLIYKKFMFIKFRANASSNNIVLQKWLTKLYITKV